MLESIATIFKDIGIPAGIIAYFLFKDFKQGVEQIRINTVGNKNQEAQIKATEQNTEWMRTVDGRLSKLEGQRGVKE